MRCGVTCESLCVKIVSVQHILANLEHPDPAVVKTCCDILKEVGTQKCLPELEKLLQNSGHSIKFAARSARQEVHRRLAGRSP